MASSSRRRSEGRPPGGWRRRVPTAALLASLGLVATFGAAAPSPAGAQPEPSAGVVHVPPVDAPVIDAFRPPPQPWAPGNRGVDYATAPLTPVRATAAGEVVFAGQVGGALHVTVRHADGLRTTMSFLASIEVRAGERVAQGDVLGRSGDALHVGVRTPDGTYLDPLLLFVGRVEVQLLPGGDDGTPPPDPVPEQRALVAVVRDRAPVLGALLTGAGVLADPGAFATRLAVLRHYATELPVGTHLHRVQAGLLDHLLRPPPCTPADVVPPPPSGRRIVVLVAGIGSTSEHAAIDGVDTGSLGVAPGDVVRFSYAGGRTPVVATGSLLADLPASAYTAVDSQAPLERSGERLAGLLDAVAEAHPGVEIDVVAHSQGGVVARLALADAAGRGALPPEVRSLVTLGSPHEGADLATAMTAVAADPEGAVALDVLRRELGIELDPGLPAGHQLAEVSPVIERLRRTPVPDGVRFTSIGARGDLVVPAGRTAPPAGGGHHTVVDLTGVDAHDRLPASPAATREIALALDGRPPTCRDAATVLADLAVPEAVSATEDLLGLTALLGATALAP